MDCGTQHDRNPCGFNHPLLNLLSRTGVWKARAKAFFIEDRRYHYAQLSSAIFWPLIIYAPVHALHTNGLATNWSVLGFRYDISEVRSSHYFEYAKKHLAKDVPTFLASVEELEKQSKQHNQEVLEYVPVAQKKVEDTLSKIASVNKTLNPTFSSEPVAFPKIFLQPVLEILARYWLTDILVMCSHGKELGQAIAELSPFEKDYPGRIEGATYRLASYGVAEGLSSSQEKRLTYSLIELRQNWEILSNVVAFEDRQEKMEQKAKELSKQVGALYHLIDAQRYETVCDCCPQES
jgi:hypothetical protein